MTTFAEMGFAPVITGSSATPETDGYLGTLNAMPYHIHPTATPEQWAALEVAIAGGLVAVTPYTAPPPVVLTLAQQAQASLAAPLAITSASAGLSSVPFAVNSESQSHMQAEMIALLNSGGTTFADGTSSLVWPDASGVNRTFNLGQAKALFLAAGAYVAALYKCINGTLTTLPPPAVTIP